MSIYKGDTLIAGGGLKSGTVSAGTTVQNVNDTVVEYYMSSDKKSWYRKWASGWKECGGIVTSSSDTTSTVYFSLSFTEKPVVIVNLEYPNSSVLAGNYLSAWDIGTTSFKKHLWDGGASEYYACGW